MFAPSPILTITIEAGNDGDEVHVHAGGQGFWIARMLAVLGPNVTLCGCFTGEAGQVLRTIVPEAGIDTRAMSGEGQNVTYVHDRRGGERVEVARTTPTPLSRHRADDLYGAALTCGLDAAVTVLAGSDGEGVVAPEMYQRLARDLTSNDRTVVADLSGDELRAALDGGLSVLKVSDDELLADGWIRSLDSSAVAAACREIVAAGAKAVVVTRAEQGLLAAVGDELCEVRPPQLVPLDHRGAGDSVTAGLTAALSRGASFGAALRLGVAAGALNVTRRGLASGQRDQIERFAAFVEIHHWDGH